MSLKEKLASGKFVITAEVNPPKGTDIASIIAKVAELRGKVDAINVTDNTRAMVKLHPLPLCVRIKEAGIEPICQFTCRDRNRIALQSDLLSASVFGISSILALGGDPVHIGDHPEAKSVFDVDILQLLAIAKTLNSGKDSTGNALSGTPAFHIGAAANPCAKDLNIEISKCKAKVAHGAHFFQTQPVYDVNKLIEFVHKYKQAGLDTPLIVGLIPLRSAENARFMNANIPGIHVPDALISELETATDPKETGLAQAARLLKELRPHASGVHIMPIGAGLSSVSRILELARL